MKIEGFFYQRKPGSWLITHKTMGHVRGISSDRKHHLLDNLGQIIKLLGSQGLGDSDHEGSGDRHLGSATSGLWSLCIVGLQSWKVFDSFLAVFILAFIVHKVNGAEKRL